MPLALFSHSPCWELINNNHEIYYQKPYFKCRCFSKMDTNDPQQLEKLKDRLKDRMGIPVGWHMSGIPLVGAMILSMFAFALAQPYLWLAVFELFGLPQYAVMAAIVPVSLIYSLIMVLTMYFVARGNFLALKLSLALMAFSGLVAIVYFLSVCLGALFGAD